MVVLLISCLRYVDITSMLTIICRNRFVGSSLVVVDGFPPFSFKSQTPRRNRYSSSFFFSSISLYDTKQPNRIIRITAMTSIQHWQIGYGSSSAS